MRQKVACFSMLVFLVTLFLLSGEIGKTGANGPPKMTKTTKLEAKLAKIEADLKQMKSEFSQVEKGLSEMKEGLGKIQKKMVSDEEVAEKAAKKQMLNNKRNSIPFWPIIAIVIVLVGMCIIAEILTRKPPNKRVRIK